jgi:hypothetical protein
MRLLANFLKKSALIVHIYNSQPFQSFIRNKQPYDVLSKSIKPLANLDLYLNFKDNFPIEPSFEYSEETNIYVLQIVHYLSNSLDMVKKLKQSVKKNIDQFHTMKYNLCKLMAGIKELSPVFKYTCEVQFNVKKKRYQMYQILLDWARSEILDIQAMIEGIHRMQEITENFKIKIDNSLKNLLEENLENTQLKAQIISMVQQRLVLYEIPRFRESKASKWETALRTFINNGNLEMKNLEDLVMEIDKNFNS